MLKYVLPFSNAMAATLAIGQTSTGSNSLCDQGGAAPTASTLCGPTAASFDSRGNLWVSDSGDNRVLEYVPPFTNGMAATMVIGQTDFIHGPASVSAPNCSSQAASNLCLPIGLSFDSDGNLSVADSFNSRVLIFSPPFSNGMNATTVIGQTNFTTAATNQGGSSPAANTLANPYGVLAF